MSESLALVRSIYADLDRAAAERLAEWRG